MNVAAALDWLQGTSSGRSDSRFAALFPLLESVHVIGLAMVFGTILIVDLRLLGLATSNRPFQRLAADTLRWTRGAFALTAITGALMFLTNASVYFHNGYFRAKVALLALAAINALVFELTTRRTVVEWDLARSAPPLAPRGGGRCRWSFGSASSWRAG